MAGTYLNSVENFNVIFFPFREFGGTIALDPGPFPLVTGGYYIVKDCPPLFLDLFGWEKVERYTVNYVSKVKYPQSTPSDLILGRTNDYVRSYKLIYR